MQPFKLRWNILVHCIRSFIYTLTLQVWSPLTRIANMMSQSLCIIPARWSWKGILLQLFEMKTWDQTSERMSNSLVWTVRQLSWFYLLWCECPWKEIIVKKEINITLLYKCDEYGFMTQLFTASRVHIAEKGVLSSRSW